MVGLFEIYDFIMIMKLIVVNMFVFIDIETENREIEYTIGSTLTLRRVHIILLRTGMK